MAWKRHQTGGFNGINWIKGDITNLAIWDLDVSDGMGISWYLPYGAISALQTTGSQIWSPTIGTEWFCTGKLHFKGSNMIQRSSVSSGDFCNHQPMGTGATKSDFETARSFDKRSHLQMRILFNPSIGFPANEKTCADSGNVTETEQHIFFSRVIFSGLNKDVYYYTIC